MIRLRSILQGAAAAAVLASAGFAQQSDITVALQLEPPHLDPTSAAAGAIDSVLYSNVFEGLTRFASDGSIVPGLAESWEISDHGLTYICLLYTSPSPRDRQKSRMPSSA